MMAGSGNGTIWHSLKRFDAYPKTMESFKIKTLHGAIVTLISSLVMISLFLSELSFYLTLEIRQELFVDTSRSHGEKLRINLNITFPKWPCAYLSVDAMDVSGEHQFDLDHSLFKTRLDADSNPMISADAKVETELGEGKLNVTDILDNEDDINKDEETMKTEEKEENSKCGSCYGAESETIPCCNTCDQVREAYRKKGWGIDDPDNIEQCANEGWKTNFLSQAKEGCNIQGYISVSKVAGNVHFAPGQSYQQKSIHLHDLQPFGKNFAFNISHVIHNLSFGFEYPGMYNPLDSHLEIDQLGSTTSGNTMYQYFIKIVPTQYWKVNGAVLKSNQYSVTKHQRQVKMSISENGLPGVFFIYDINPMMIQIKEFRKSFLHFLTGICAIIGGIFTVAGMIDAFIYQSNKALLKKIDLGKAS